MIRRALPVLSLAVSAPALVAADTVDDRDGVLLAQLGLRQRVVIRIPRLPPPAPRVSYAAPARPVVWRERKAPACIPTDTLAAASIGADGDVDLIVNDGRRLRAKLDDDCPTLNFYRGFYLKSTADGMLCARRDVLRSRSGAQCRIARFRTLVARK